MRPASLSSPTFRRVITWSVSTLPLEAQDRSNRQFDEVKAAQERIRANQRRQGHLGASSKVARDVNDTEHTVAMEFQIDPGPLYTLGKLDIVGLDVVTEPEIRKMWFRLGKLRTLSGREVCKLLHAQCFIKVRHRGSPVLCRSGLLKPQLQCPYHSILS